MQRQRTEDQIRLRQRLRIVEHIGPAELNLREAGAPAARNLKSGGLEIDRHHAHTHPEQPGLGHQMTRNVAGPGAEVENGQDIILRALAGLTLPPVRAPPPGAHELIDNPVGAKPLVQTRQIRQITTQFLADRLRQIHQLGFIGIKFALHHLAARVICPKTDSGGHQAFAGSTRTVTAVLSPIMDPATRRISPAETASQRAAKSRCQSTPNP